MARPAKPVRPKTACYQCGGESFGYMVCPACYEAGRPFRPDAFVMERPRAGADRRRKGGVRAAE